MNKRWILAIALIGIAAWLAPAFSQTAPPSQPRFGVVQLSKLFTGYDHARELEKQAQEEQKAFNDKVDALVKSLKSIKDELENLDPEGELYAKLRREASMKQSELQYLQEEEKPRLQKKLDGMTQEVLHHLEDAVRVFGQEHGYTAIFRVDEAPEGVDRAVQFSVTTVLYWDPSMDITEPLTSWLNSRK